MTGFESELPPYFCTITVPGFSDVSASLSGSRCTASVLGLFSLTVPKPPNVLLVL